jgi:hypothetical protein
MKHLITFLFIVVSYSISAQADTLGRFDEKGRKTGYHIAYYDSAFHDCSVDVAAYRYYVFYRKGKDTWGHSELNPEDHKVQYIPESKNPPGEIPELLNGDIVYIGYDSIDLRRTYHQGFPSTTTEYMYEVKNTFTVPLGQNTVYHDSLYAGIPSSALVYSYRDSMAVWKQYVRAGRARKEYMYLNVASKHDLFAPRIGYTQQCRNFAELGFSWKQCPLVKHTDNSGAHTYDNFFPGATVSMLGSWNKNRDYIAEKAVFSYTALLVHSEAGFVHYGSGGRSDLRFTIGTGISLSGIMSIMYHYSHPLLESPFTDISRHSLSIVLF